MPYFKTGTVRCVSSGLTFRCRIRRCSTGRCSRLPILVTPLEGIVRFRTANENLGGSVTNENDRLDLTSIQGVEELAQKLSQGRLRRSVPHSDNPNILRVQLAPQNHPKAKLSAFEKGKAIDIYLNTTL